MLRVCRRSRRRSWRRWRRKAGTDTNQKQTRRNGRSPDRSFIPSSSSQRLVSYLALKFNSVMMTQITLQIPIMILFGKSFHKFIRLIFQLSKLAAYFYLLNRIVVRMVRQILVRKSHRRRHRDWCHCVDHRNHRNQLVDRNRIHRLDNRHSLVEENRRRHMACRWCLLGHQDRLEFHWRCCYHLDSHRRLKNHWFIKHEVSKSN